MATRVRVFHPGVAMFLKSTPVRTMVDGVAERVAAEVRGQGHHVTSGADLPVEVTSYTTDRAAAMVVVTHPAGIGMQARHGVLTKAASACGLEVKGEST